MLKRVYTAGKRFEKLRNATLFVCMILVFLFYFIYRWLLLEKYPNFVGAPLITIFILVGVLIWVGVDWACDKIKAHIRYEVAPDALVVGKGKTLHRFPYTSFEKVEFDGFRYRSQLPVIFYIDGKQLTLNQYVDDIFELAHQILVRLDPAIPVDPKLIERIEVFRDI